MTIKFTGLTLLCAGLIYGCGSSDKTPQSSADSGTNQVEMFSWWINSGEAEALQALVDVNATRHPTDIIFNAAAASGTDAKALLATRLAAHNPPDLFQGNAADLSAFVAANPGSLEPLDSFLSTENITSAIFPEVLKDVTVNGIVYSMPNNIHRENALFYNKQVLAAHNVTPPTTLTEFLAACQTLKTAGVTPVATAYQGWIIRIMFNSLAMMSMGTNSFHTFMTGGTRDDTALLAAMDVLDNVLTNYVNSNATDTSVGWTQAADLVHDGQAAMYFHGDWAKGYLQQRWGWSPGTDFGVIAAPGAADMFWYGVDTFSVPVGAKNSAGAFDFLDTIGSIEGQVAFNKAKGSTPVRSDIPNGQLDSEGQLTLSDFKTATYHMLVVGSDAWDTALLAFANTRDKQALLKAYTDNPPPKQ